MHGKPALAIGTLAALAVFAAANPGVATANPCKPRHATDTHHHGTAYSFNLTRSARDPRGHRHGSGHYACDIRYKHWYRLEPNSHWLLSTQHLSSGYVGFTLTRAPGLPGGHWPWYLDVRSLRNGHFEHRVGFRTGPFVSDFVIDSHGGLGYIGYTLRHGEFYYWYYWVVRVAPHKKVVATSRGIHDRSLVRRGGRMVWHGGRIHHSVDL